MPPVTETVVDFSGEGEMGTPSSPSDKNAEERGAIERQSLEEIVQMISDPDTDLAAVYKKIALQIAYLSLEFTICRKDLSAQYQLKPVSEQIKALRELSRTLSESDEVSRRDILNFDGPRFAYVLGQIVELFKKSMAEAGLPSSMIDNILRIYRDKMALNEARLRKETAVIETSRGPRE